MQTSPAQEFAKLQSLTPQEAVDYLQRRDRLTQTFSWQDLWHDEHAKQFTVSRMARMDILSAMQDGITKSVQGDLTRRDWMSDTKALLKKEGWWGEKDVLDPVFGEVVTTRFDSARLKLIFDTNTRMANSAGLWDRVWRNRSTHPYVRYITRGDERVRLQHRRWANLTLPADHPFWEKHWPPNGWRCRCRVMSMTKAEFDRRSAAGELQTEAPPEEFITWTNKRTGETSEVPVGIQPGFDYNPGLSKARNAMLQKIGGDKLDAAPSPIRHAAMSVAVGDDVTGAFAKAVSESFSALPINARRAVAAGGYQVQVVKRLSDAFPELLQSKPSGYAADLSFNQVDGLTWHARGLILIAEQIIDAQSGLWVSGTVTRAKALLLHEIGHVLDGLNDFSSDAAVAMAWRNEANDLLKYLGKFGGSIDAEISYFADGKFRATREVVAELYAARYGLKTTGAVDVATAFPDTMRTLYQLLDSQGL